MRPVHRAVQRVIEAAGAGVGPAGGRSGASCCGALHGHAGLGDDARRLARRMMAALPGRRRRSLVDSAGCGAQLKDYGRLLGTDEAAARSAPGCSTSTSGWPSGSTACPPARRRLPGRWRSRTRATCATSSGPTSRSGPCSRRYVDVVELDDEGLCCGAGGAYATVQPELAGAIRDRKLAAIERSGATVVASANPGCACT